MAPTSHYHGFRTIKQLIQAINTANQATSTNIDTTNTNDKTTNTHNQHEHLIQITKQLIPTVKQLLQTTKRVIQTNKQLIQATKTGYKQPNSDHKVSSNTDVGTSIGDGLNSKCFECAILDVIENADNAHKYRRTRTQPRRFMKVPNVYDMLCVLEKYRCDSWIPRKLFETSMYASSNTDISTSNFICLRYGVCLCVCMCVCVWVHGPVSSVFGGGVALASIPMKCSVWSFSSCITVLMFVKMLGHRLTLSGRLMSLAWILEYVLSLSFTVMRQGPRLIMLAEGASLFGMSITVSLRSCAT